MDLDLGYWIQVLRGHCLKKRGGSACSKGKVDPLVLAPKWCLDLWRPDLSFSNSVTGSGSRAKCSNILQDILSKANNLREGHYRVILTWVS
jgi:hypothetical protein